MSKTQMASKFLKANLVKSICKQCREHQSLWMLKVCEFGRLECQEKSTLEKGENSRGGRERGPALESYMHMQVCSGNSGHPDGSFSDNNGKLKCNFQELPSKEKVGLTQLRAKPAVEGRYMGIKSLLWWTKLSEHNCILHIKNSVKQLISVYSLLISHIHCSSLSCYWFRK